MSDSCTKIRLSVSRKDKQTGEYETDFSGFVVCIGTAAAGKALKLKEGDRIKLGDCDVTTKYVKEKNTTYTNYKLFSFEAGDELEGAPPKQDPTDPQPTVDSGEVEDDSLPF